MPAVTDMSVPYKDSVGFDVRGREAAREPLCVRPVRRRPPSIEQPGGSQEEGSRAHAGHASEWSSVRSHRRKLRLFQVKDTRAADHHKRIDRTLGKRRPQVRVST